jgi:hypothetical protein
MNFIGRNVSMMKDYQPKYYFGNRFLSNDAKARIKTIEKEKKKDKKKNKDQKLSLAQVLEKQKQQQKAQEVGKKDLKVQISKENKEIEKEFKEKLKENKKKKKRSKSKTNDQPTATKKVVLKNILKLKESSDYNPYANARTPKKKESTKERLLGASASTPALTPAALKCK